MTQASVSENNGVNLRCLHLLNQFICSYCSIETFTMQTFYQLLSIEYFGLSNRSALSP